IFLGSYFSLLGIIAASHLVMRGIFHWDYAPRIVWPCREFAMGYVQVFCLSLLLCLLYLNFYHDLHEAPLIGLTVGVASLSVVFAILRLSASEGALGGFGIAATIAALMSWLVIRLSGLSPESLAEWSKPPYLLLVVGLFAILASGRLTPLMS